MEKFILEIKQAYVLTVQLCYVSVLAVKCWVFLEVTLNGSKFINIHIEQLSTICVFSVHIADISGELSNTIPYFV